MCQPVELLHGVLSIDDALTKFIRIADKSNQHLKDFMTKVQNELETQDIDCSILGNFAYFDNK